MARTKALKKMESILHMKISKEQDDELRERAEEFGLTKSAYIRLLFAKALKEKFL